MDLSIAEWIDAIPEPWRGRLWTVAAVGVVSTMIVTNINHVIQLIKGKAPLSAKWLSRLGYVAALLSTKNPKLPSEVIKKG